MARYVADDPTSVSPATRARVHHQREQCPQGQRTRYSGCQDPFKNIHYFTAGAPLFGSDVQGAYQYEGKPMLASTTHPYQQCTDCREVHSLEPRVETCAVCHGGVIDPAIRMTAPITMVTAMPPKAWARSRPWPKPCMPRHPEVCRSAWRRDLRCRASTCTSTAQMVSATPPGPRLPQGCLQLSVCARDPGRFVHNPKYVVQFLIDSIKDLGSDVTGYTAINSTKAGIAQRGQGNLPPFYRRLSASLSVSYLNQKAKHFSVYLSQTVTAFSPHLLPPSPVRYSSARESGG